MFRHCHSSTTTRDRLALCVAIPLMGLIGSPLTAVAADTSAAQELARWSAQAGMPPNADRGQAFFQSRAGGEWSCASCHGMPPLKPGQHAVTAKPIEPLAPIANPKAFTDSARSDKWFRRNCKDVLSRECTAAEKADVLAFLMGLK